jgi:hypothetical protein
VFVLLSSSDLLHVTTYPALLCSLQMRPESLAKSILEFYAKRYTKEYLKRELYLERDRLIKPGYNPGRFSTFRDKRLYGGIVPTGTLTIIVLFCDHDAASCSMAYLNIILHIIVSGHWLQTAYMLYSASIIEHLNREVKKRGCRQLSWDASYKEGKKMCRYHGKSIFSALITGINAEGEIRVQFHVVTDGQDQFETPIAALLQVQYVLHSVLHYAHMYRGGQERHVRSS